MATNIFSDSLLSIEICPSKTTEKQDDERCNRNFDGYIYTSWFTGYHTTRPRRRVHKQGENVLIFIKELSYY